MARERQSVRRRDRSRPIEGGEKREGRKKGSVGNERERERSGREKNQRRGAACGENKIRSDRDTGGHRGGGEKRTKKRGRRTRRRRRRRRREWGRQKEARVIGRRGRTSEGEHLPRTSYESRGGPPPRSCRRCSACGPKKIARKKERAGRRTTRIMNTYACRGGTSFTARHDREEIGPVKEDTPRDTIRARARPPRLPSRCSRRCNATEIIVHSSSTSSSPPSLLLPRLYRSSRSYFSSPSSSRSTWLRQIWLHLHTTPWCYSPKHLGSGQVEYTASSY